MENRLEGKVAIVTGAESWVRRQEVRPMNRFNQPEELANAILFVVSDEASWVSGVTIILDGGKWAALQ